MSDDKPTAHLVNAAAPAMLKLLRRVADGSLTPEDAVDIMLDWPEKVALQKSLEARREALLARIQRDEAIASTRLDRDPDGGTHSLDEVSEGGRDGAP